MAGPELLETELQTGDNSLSICFLSLRVTRSEAGRGEAGETAGQTSFSVLGIEPSSGHDHSTPVKMILEPWRQAL